MAQRSELFLATQIVDKRCSKDRLFLIPGGDPAYYIPSLSSISCRPPST